MSLKLNYTDENWRLRAREFIQNRCVPKSKQLDALLLAFPSSHLSIVRYLTSRLGIQLQELVPDSLQVSSTIDSRSKYDQSRGPMRAHQVSSRTMGEYLTLLTSVLVAELPETEPFDESEGKIIASKPIIDMADLLIECRTRAAGIKGKLFMLDRHIYRERAVNYGGTVKEIHQIGGQMNNTSGDLQRIIEDELSYRKLDTVINVPISMSKQVVQNPSDLSSWNTDCIQSKDGATRLFSLFMSEPWILLLSIIGKARMRTLLQDVCMFELSSPAEAAFVQISGPPLSDLVSWFQRTKTKIDTSRGAKHNSLKMSNTKVQKHSTKLPRSQLFYSEAPKSMQFPDCIQTGSNSHIPSLMTQFPPTNNGARAIIAVLFNIPIAKKTPGISFDKGVIQSCGEQVFSYSGKIEGSSTCRRRLYDSLEQKRSAKQERRKLRRHPQVEREEVKGQIERSATEITVNEACLSDAKGNVSQVSDKKAEVKLYSSSWHIPIPKHLRHLIPVFKEVLRRFRFVHFDKTLRCLRVPQSLKVKLKNLPDESCERLSTLLQEGSVNLEQLAAGIARTLNGVFPRRFFWRSKANAKQVLNLTLRFIFARRSETILYNHLDRGIRTASIPWLVALRNSKRTSVYTVAVLRTILRFLLVDFMMPVISASFYVTDAEGDQSTLRFYPHRVWTQISQVGLLSFTETFNNSNQSNSLRRVPNAYTGDKAVSGQVIQEGDYNPLYKKLDRDEAVKFLLSQAPKVQVSDKESMQPLGYSYARFKPKRGEIRPIVNMARRTAIQNVSSHPKTNKVSGERTTFTPINVSLRPTLEILQSLSDNLQLVRGSFIKGYAEVHYRLKQFADSLLQQIKSYPNEPLQVYACTLDLEKCYDNIPRDRLMTIIERVVSMASRYIQIKYKLVQAIASSTRVRSLRSTHPTGIVKEPMKAFQGTSIRESLVESKSTEKSPVKQLFHAKSVIYLEAKSQPAVYSSESIVSHLRLHLNYNIIRLRNSFYIQARGVPQGSSISALLANIYISAVEASTILPVLEAKKSPFSLMRQMDDFMYISTSKSQCEEFMKVISSVRMRRLGLILKESKTSTTFSKDYVQGIRAILGGTTPLKWNGLLLHVGDNHTQTNLRAGSEVVFCITADFSKLLGGNLRDGVTLRYNTETKARGALHDSSRLGQILIWTLTPRTIPLLFDRDLMVIQSTSQDEAMKKKRTIAALNVYQLFYFAGLKLLAVCHEISESQSIPITKSKLIHFPKVCDPIQSLSVLRPNAKEVFCGLGASTKDKSITMRSFKCPEQWDKDVYGDCKSLTPPPHHSWFVARMVLSAILDSIEFVTGTLSSRLAFNSPVDTLKPSIFSARGDAVYLKPSCAISRAQIRFLALTAFKDSMLQVRKVIRHVKDRHKAKRARPRTKQSTCDAQCYSVSGCELTWRLLVAVLEHVSSPLRPHCKAKHAPYITAGRPSSITSKKLSETLLSCLSKDRNKLLHILRYDPRIFKNNTQPLSTNQTDEALEVKTPIVDSFQREVQNAKRIRLDTDSAVSSVDAWSKPQKGTQNQMSLVGSQLKFLRDLLPFLREESSSLMTSVAF